MYQNRRQSYDARLDEYHLKHDIEIALSSPAHQIVNYVALLLTQSPLQYRFNETGLPGFAPLELLPLSFMYITGRGSSTRRDGQIRLKVLPHSKTATWNVNDLLNQKTTFALPTCVNEGRLAVYLGKQ